MNKTAKVFLAALLLLMLPLASVQAEPFAYSVNSDSPDAEFADSLYRIDLATGDATAIGKLRPLEPQIRSDIEGLAFDSNGVLFGADDADETLLTISTLTGQAQAVAGNVFNMQLGQGDYDFGLTFTCAGDLLMVADLEQSLFDVDDAVGTSFRIGQAGSLNAPISGIAAYGDTVYGIGQGINDLGQQVAPNLYTIDPVTGTSTLVGPLTNAAPYQDAGLAFDTEGKLWAITDRRNVNNQDLPSQILSIDTATGTATVVAEISPVNGAQGFESLAIASPSGCSGSPPSPPRDPFVPHIGIPAVSPTGLIAVFLVLLLTGAASLNRRL